MAVDGTYQPKVYKTAGGDELVVADGGVITVQSGGSIVAESGSSMSLPDIALQPADIGLAIGSIIVGTTGAKGVALDAKTTGRILVGDGTTIASVAVSNDATLAANGALTIANGAVEHVMLAANAVEVDNILNATITAAKLADGAGVAALLAAGLGGSHLVIKSETEDHTIVAAHGTKDRACLVVATVTEAFATGDTSRTMITVGEADTPAKMWANTAFPNALGLGTVLVGAFTNTATKAITVSSVAAAGTGTGAVSITVIAIPTT
jgi:hypothetical protein